MSPLKLIFTSKIHSLEYDPHAQYKFNLFFFWFWLAQMPLVLFLLWQFNHLWLEISIVYLTEASLWANLATHFGGMSSALAAHNQQDPTNSKGGA